MARGLLVWELTGSYADVGIVSFAAGLPMFIFSPFGGAIADRINKRDLIIASQIILSAALLGIALLILLDLIEVWHLILAAIANGLMMAVNLPTRQAIVPQLVRKSQVMNAVALNSGSQNLNRVLAPGLGGLVIGLAGFSEVYFLMMILAWCSAFLMFFVRLDAATDSYRESVGSYMMAGVKYVRSVPAIRDLVIMAIVPVVLGMPYMMELGAFARDILDVSHLRAGILYSATGVGALAGSLAIAALGNYHRKGVLLISAAAFFGLTLVLLSLSTGFYIPFLILLGVGIANAVYLVVNNTLILMNTEAAMHGRVMGLYSMSIALFPMAVWPVGELMDLFSPRLVFGACGGIIMMFSIVMLLYSPTLRRL